jgi:phosphoribosylformimino-5-aminoimidazole carboxamide ribotide isomerase
MRDIGVRSAVFGRAYYEGKITLKDLENFIQEA